VKIESNQFSELPFSKLFTDYVSGRSAIQSFFEVPILDKTAVQSHLDNFTFKGNREEAAELIKNFNKKFTSDKNVFNQIEYLKEHDTLTVVTGQQVTICGGPLYTIYKTASAIVYARQLSKLSGRRVVPVFWLADEDHDIDEVSTLTTLNSNGLSENRYHHKNYSHSPPPAGTIKLGDEFERFKEELKSSLDETDFSESVWELFNECYQKENTFAQGFGRLLLSLFGSHGLVLAGSYDDSVKQYSRELFAASVKLREKANHELDESTYRLIENGYHGQVQVQPSNLFYVDEEQGRQKIQYVDGRWIIPGKSWSDSELLDEIDTFSERFSPNVFLRPLLQDRLLPVVAYVGGPGEIAYYAQMKRFYGVFGQKMPVIVPRFSGTIIEASIDRIMDDLPFSWTEYNQRIEDLETEYVKKTESVDIEKLFTIWRSHIEELSRAKKSEISEIDPTLEGTVGKAKATYFSELDKLKGKVYRSVKKQDQIQIDRINRIKNNLFPNNNLQEREISSLHYMNKYGLSVWDRLIESLKDEEPFTHKKIYI